MKKNCGGQEEEEKNYGEAPEVQGFRIDRKSVRLNKIRRDSHWGGGLKRDAPLLWIDQGKPFYEIATSLRKEPSEGALRESEKKRAT